MRRLLAGKAIEEEYGIPEATLRTMRVRGGGPTFLKLGSRCLYRIEDLEAWLLEHRVASTAEVKANRARRRT